MSNSYLNTFDYGSFLLDSETSDTDTKSLQEDYINCLKSKDKKRSLSSSNIFNRNNSITNNVKINLFRFDSHEKNMFYYEFRLQNRFNILNSNKKNNGNKDNKSNINEDNLFNKIVNVKTNKNTSHNKNSSGIIEEENNLSIDATINSEKESLKFIRPNNIKQTAENGLYPKFFNSNNINNNILNQNKTKENIENNSRVGTNKNLLNSTSSDLINKSTGFRFKNILEKINTNIGSYDPSGNLSLGFDLNSADRMIQNDFDNKNLQSNNVLETNTSSLLNNNSSFRSFKQLYGGNNLNIAAANLEMKKIELINPIMENKALEDIEIHLIDDKKDKFNSGKESKSKNKKEDKSKSKSKLSGKASPNQLSSKKHKNAQKNKIGSKDQIEAKEKQNKNSKGTNNDNEDIQNISNNINDKNPSMIKQNSIFESPVKSNSRKKNHNNLIFCENNAIDGQDEKSISNNTINLNNKKPAKKEKETINSKNLDTINTDEEADKLNELNFDDLPQDLALNINEVNL